MQLTASMRPTEHGKGVALKRMVRTGDRDARREAFEVGSVWLFPWTACGTTCCSRRWRAGSRTGILHLLKLIPKASGRRGVPQGGVISPSLSNVYLHEVDGLERAKAVTRNGAHTNVEYARYADDLVILVNNDRRQAWLLRAVDRRLREEFAKLDLRLNEAKSRIVDLSQGESFGFLGFDFRRVRSWRGAWRPQYTPRQKSRTALLRELKAIFRRY